jgi:hypothetical protein
MNYRYALFAALAICLSLPAMAQPMVWKTDLTFYGDNTEFTGPYREGETILGAQLQTFLELTVSPKVTVLAGVFADKRSGGEKFLNPVDPILSFRWHDRGRMFILGALETHDRHGLLEPLEVTTLELTRPLENGLQYISRSAGHSFDGFINWQKLNTPQHREVLDYGGVFSQKLGGGVSAELQLHGVHHGGQLYDVGPLFNDVAAGPGLRWQRGTADLAAFFLTSRTSGYEGHPERSTTGEGAYLRLGWKPRARDEFFGIAWRGRDFYASEGDFNYNSLGQSPDIYRRNRSYEEVGARHTFDTGSPRIRFTAELRLHDIEGRATYSYRLLARVPLDVPLRRAP